MSRFATIKAELRQMLGPDVGIGVADPKSSGEKLLPEEKPAMARAVQKRRLEFISGRVAARQAMSALDHPPIAIPMAADRSPVWPDGLVGSITHCDDICIAAVALGGSKLSIGIDIEPATPLSPDLEEVICLPSERIWLGTQPPERRGYFAKQIFCVKESIYKALYPITGEVIDFDALELSLPLRQDAPVILKTDELAEGLNIESNSCILGSHIFAYASLVETSVTMSQNSGLQW